MDNAPHGCDTVIENNFDEIRSMLIGILGLGMLFGSLSGALALLAGQSFLTALWLYASVGTLSALTIAVGLYAVRGVQRSFGETIKSRLQ